MESKQEGPEEVRLEIGLARPLVLLLTHNF